MPLCRKPPSLPPSCQLGSGSQHSHYGSASGCQCAFPSKVPFLPNCPPRTWISSCSPTARHREGKPTLSQTHVAAIHTEKTTVWRRSCNEMVFGIGGSAALWLPGRGEAEHCNSNCQRLPMQTGGGCACQLHQGPQDPLLLTHPWASRRASPVGTDSSAKGCSAIHFTSVTCRPPDEPEYSVREGCLTAPCYLFNKESCYRRHTPLCLSTNSDFENLGQPMGASCGSVIQGGLKPPRSLAAPFVPSYSTAGGAVLGGGYLYPAVMWDRDQTWGIWFCCLAQKRITEICQWITEIHTNMTWEVFSPVLDCIQITKTLLPADSAHCLHRKHRSYWWGEGKGQGTSSHVLLSNS